MPLNKYNKTQYYQAKESQLLIYSEGLVFPIDVERGTNYLIYVEEGEPSSFGGIMFFSYGPLYIEPGEKYKEDSFDKLVTRNISDTRLPPHIITQYISTKLNILKPQWENLTPEEFDKQLNRNDLYKQEHQYYLADTKAREKEVQKDIGVRNLEKRRQLERQFQAFINWQKAKE